MNLPTLKETRARVENHMDIAALAEMGLDVSPVDAFVRCGVAVRLYLDDNRKCPVGWHACRSVREAIMLMREFRVTEASLDHDLGACSKCLRDDPEAARMLHCKHIPDGRAFVAWMIAVGCWPEQKPVVHSFNQKGREQMRAMIDAHWRPPTNS